MSIQVTSNLYLGTVDEILNQRSRFDISGNYYDPRHFASTNHLPSFLVALSPYKLSSPSIASQKSHRIHSLSVSLIMASDSVAVAPPATGALAGDAAAKPKKSKSDKETKAKKPAAPRKSRSASSHPPFLVMITEAIVALKERTGSSLYAIAKYIEENHKQLPGNFRKLLLVQLKRFVASGKLVKVKNSFKLSPGKKKAEKKSAAAEKEKPKKKAATVAGAKRKAAAEKKSPAKKAKKTATVAATTKEKAPPVKKPKSVKSPVKKPKSVKSPAKKPKSVKSPAKKPATGKRAKK